VYVLNPPYLLFYPDANRDDKPDRDPEVLLTASGMEDAHHVRTITWPATAGCTSVNGITTTCRIRGIEFQQGLWRYHPITHEFELFCEGGSNCYGVTFDANGEVYYSTNGGPFVNGVQGGYFYKSFGKHGPLHNLHAYHYFPELERDQVPGGPPTGGTFYGQCPAPPTANSSPATFGPHRFLVDDPTKRKYRHRHTRRPRRCTTHGAAPLTRRVGPDAPSTSATSTTTHAHPDP
jgi:hypothetical protein